MSASEVWWLVAALLALVGAVTVLLAHSDARAALLDRVGRVAAILAVGSTAMGFLVLP